MFLLAQVHARLLETQKRSAKLYADETISPVLDPGRGRIKIGQLWDYARDDRLWGGLDPPAVVFVYAPDRRAERHVRIYQDLSACCTSTAMAAIAPWPKAARCAWPSARRMCVGASTNCPKPTPRNRDRSAPADPRVLRLGGLCSRPRSEGASGRQSRGIPAADPGHEVWLRASLETISQKTKLAEAIR